MEENIWKDAEVISAYSRRDALEDGVLVDLSDLAREAGFLWPLAVTQGREVFFAPYFLTEAGKPPQQVSMRAVSGPGDDGEPAITVMIEAED